MPLGAKASLNTARVQCMASHLVRQMLRLQSESTSLHSHSPARGLPPLRTSGSQLHAAEPRAGRRQQPAGVRVGEKTRGECSGTRYCLIDFRPPPTPRTKKIAFPPSATAVLLGFLNNSSQRGIPRKILFFFPKPRYGCVRNRRPGGGPGALPTNRFRGAGSTPGCPPHHLAPSLCPPAVSIRRRFAGRVLGPPHSAVSRGVVRLPAHESPILPLPAGSRFPVISIIRSTSRVLAAATPG